jgi:hypothetical protein
MERGQLLSLQRKISQGKLRDVKVEILNFEGNLPSELVTSILDAIASGYLLDSLSLGKLIIRTRDRSLFLIAKKSGILSGGSQVLTELLRAGIPDKDIEQRLCERLAVEFEQKSWGYRQYILEALRDCGSVSCLDTLEAIEYDFSPDAFVAKTSLEALPEVLASLTEEYCQQISSEATVYIYGLLKETIAAIRQRNEEANDLWGVIERQGDPFSRSVKWRNLAANHLVQGDFGASLNYLRKATESTLKIVIDLQGIKPDKGEPVEKMLIPTMMAILMDKKYLRNPDKAIYKFLEQLRDNTTLGSHDQGEVSEKLIGPDMAKGQIEVFDKVLDYFRQYVEIKNPD